MSEVLGKPFFPHQRYCVDVTLEMDQGVWAYSLACWYQPRRSGKTVPVSPVMAAVCSQSSPMQVWLTAQKRESAVARWLDATAPLMRSDMASTLRHRISNAHEGLWWPNGSSFKPFAPDEDTMHGEDPDVVIRDEDWSFTLAQAEVVEAGYSHAFSVKPGLDIRLSAAGTARSTSMKRTRAIGRRAVEQGFRSRTAYFEWCIPEQGPDGRPIVEMPDEQLVQLILWNHPRAGRGLREDFVAAQLEKNRKDALRAYGGLDNDDAFDDGAAVDMLAMARARADKPIPADARVALAVDVDPDSLEGSVAAGYVWPGGLVQVETIERRAGVRWIRDAVAAMVEANGIGAVFVVQAGPSRGVADELARALPDDVLQRVPLADFAAACKRFRDTLVEQDAERLRLVLHDPSGALWDAVRSADERGMQSGIGWRPKSPDRPVSMLPCAALGMWAAEHLPEQTDDSFWIR